MNECVISGTEFSDSEAVQYTLLNDKTNKRYTCTIYCKECLEEMHQSCWNRLKSSLIAVDCLAALRRMVKSGVSLRMKAYDLDISFKQGLVDRFYWKDQQWSGQINAEITEQQRDSMLSELQVLLDREKKDGIDQFQIHEIMKKYIIF